MNGSATVWSKKTVKTTRSVIALIVFGIFAVFTAGFLVGGTYASGRAVRAGNEASLVYFAGIHDALTRQDYPRATAITNTAVDSHVAVLRDWASSSWLLRTWYTLPWTQRQQSLATGGSLLSARAAYTAQPEQLQANTRSFLGIQH